MTGSQHLETSGFEQYTGQLCGINCDRVVRLPFPELGIPLVTLARLPESIAGDAVQPKKDESRLRIFVVVATLSMVALDVIVAPVSESIKHNLR